MIRAAGLRAGEREIAVYIGEAIVRKVSLHVETLSVELMDFCSIPNPHA